MEIILPTSDWQCAHEFIHFKIMLDKQSQEDI